MRIVLWLGVLLIVAWLIIVLAFKVTVGLIHLILAAGLILFAIGVFRRLAHAARRHAT